MRNPYQRIDLSDWVSGVSAEVAILSLEPKELERRAGVQFTAGSDDLDDLVEAILTLPTGRQVHLVRHQHHPHPGTHVFADAQEDTDNVVAELLAVLQVGPGDIAWKRTDMTRGHSQDRSSPP